MISLHSTLSLFLHCIPFLASLLADILKGSISIAPCVAIQVASDQPISVGTLPVGSLSITARNALSKICLEERNSVLFIQM